MKTIRNYMYAALLAASALNLSPSLAAAQDTARGKFTLAHETHLGTAVLPPGDYQFSFDPDNGTRMMTLSKLSGDRTGYMVLVTDTEDSKPTDHSLLVLQSTPTGTYVSVMQLPEFGMTLRFKVPPHTPERQIARVATTAAGQ